MALTLATVQNLWRASEVRLHERSCDFNALISDSKAVVANGASRQMRTQTIPDSDEIVHFHAIDL